MGRHAVPSWTMWCDLLVNRSQDGLTSDRTCMRYSPATENTNLSEGAAKNRMPKHDAVSAVWGGVHVNEVVRPYAILDTRY